MNKITIYEKINEENLLKRIFCAPVVGCNFPPAHRGQPGVPLYPFPEAYDNYKS